MSPLNKLPAVLALLASDKPGEVVAAAAAAQRILTAHGLSFRDLVATPPAEPQALAQFDIFQAWPQRWRAGVHLCQSAPATWLSPWERQFIATLARYRHKPSEPQLDILATIAGNVIARGGAK